MTRFAGSRLALLVAILGLVGFVGLATAGTVEVRVAAGTDDAEEHLTEGNTIDLTSSDLELGEEGGDGDFQEVGMRFLDIGIPADATITSATIQFTADETDDEDTSLLIYGQLSPNPTTFTEAVADITSRPKTTSSVEWNDIPLWEVEGEAGPAQLTPDFSALVQEIIDQPDWAANNAMVVIIAPNPGGERTAESFDGDAAAAPLLKIEYTAIPEPSTIALAGLGLVAILGYGRRRRR